MFQLSSESSFDHEIYTHTYTCIKSWPLNSAGVGAMTPSAVENLHITLQSTLFNHSFTPADSANPFIKLYKLSLFSAVHFFIWVIHLMTILSGKQGKNYLGWYMSFKKKLFLRNYCQSMKNWECPSISYPKFGKFWSRKKAHFKRCLYNRLRRKRNKVSYWICIENLT